ncbi:MAG TPA: glycerophosphodiester phosphodiesterase [Rhodopirellula baltica]|uniref:Glycerophosphoryl diester phosphodiesterase n=1 Tax=Rhodopirellula baltica (strain DSM 10527 / NCIMB 13988 / SH1) TaxID=243090 RepID=Q7UV78_RHOBA|nr:glycerophosphodiester phosphodiesterase [Rhodopirellula baltica]CAD72848.1 glycerophosphoryl diester phosphodiesterase [Rhodopirellula baltica SH 1]HBE64046.1 glycerophosphodiester phosphodiesterase [Rhodopirellula baltica]
MTSIETTFFAAATRFAAAFSFVVCLGFGSLENLRGNENTVKAKPLPMIVAHRGASYTAPENTVSAFNLAWEENADAIEGDFYLSADGEIVCLHDKTTARTAPGSPSLKVAEATLQQLRKLDVGAWKHERYAGERIPTLKEVIATVPDGKGIFIEIKCGPEILPILKQQLEECSLKPEQITIICFNDEVVRQAREMMPYEANWLTSYKKQLTGGWKPSLVSVTDQLKSTNASGFGTQVKPELVGSVLNEAFCDAVRDIGCGMHGWTIDDAKVAKRLVELDFVSITTNRPAYIRDALKK